MSNLLDFNRLSDYVNAIADRRLAAISTSISSSTGFLINLVNQAEGFSDAASGYALTAQTAESNASLAASTSLMVLNDFTSTYLGSSSTEPQLSSQGNTINVGAFYIRSSDSRLRYASSVSVGGVPTYTDVTVSADPSSVETAGAGIFLSLKTLVNQTVKSPVTFQAPVLGARVTSWATQQLATAIDVNEKILVVQAAVNAETSRATAAETVLTNSKVSKSGDILTGPLQINAAGSNSSFILRNTTSGSGRIVRISLQDSGSLKIIDDTSGADRLVVQPNGDIFASNSVSVVNTVVTKNFISNQIDSNDAGYAVHKSGVPRWYIRRSDAAQRFYISRMNSLGVYVDTPLLINESDGSLILNKTSVTDTFSAVGTISVSGIGASVVLNNTSSGAGSLLVYKHNGVTRWTVGRTPTGQNYSIRRFNSSGALVDVPLSVSESTGLLSLGDVSSSGTIVAATSISSPIIYATASGDGRSIRVGNDAWLGDIDFANTMSVRGVSDINAGFISFGNSLLKLGCNAGDNKLRYNNNEMWHAGNFNPNEYVRVVASSNSETGGYRIYSDGYKECWGRTTVVGNVQNHFISYPAGVNFTTYSNANINGSSFGVDAKDNFVSIYNCTTTGFYVNNPDDSTVTAWWQARGY